MKKKILVFNLKKNNYEKTWAYCCSIGMKPFEFPDGNYPEVHQKLLLGL
jgi:hypothetical protein